MKLVTFSDGQGEHVGWLQEDGRTVLQIELTVAGAPVTLQDIVAQGAALIDRIQADRARFQTHALSDIRVMPPLPAPKGIFCVGLNYAEHAAEAPVSGSDYPTIFLRLARNQIAHLEPMIAPKASQTLDWEGELVAVIGTGGRHIPADQALSHVFGYSIYNEASVRAFQHHSSQFGLGKNFEGTGAFGPCIVTADAFGDPYRQSIRTTIDGEEVQSAPIDQMLHRIEDVIAYLSSATTLEPGDIICTGTPSGVGAARKPQRFLRDGETVSVSVSGIGTLTNPVRQEA